MALPRNICNPLPFERVEINLWNTTTKEIIFTGTKQEIADYLKIPYATVCDAYRYKRGIRGMYVLRVKSVKK